MDHFCGILAKVHNLNLIMRKHQITQIEGHSTKLQSNRRGLIKNVKIIEDMLNHETQRTEFHILKETKGT